MIGMVVVGHGRIGEEMVRTIETVLGPTDALAAVPTTLNDGPDDVRARIESAAADVDRGHGVIILTDMLGDTPTNQSLRLARERGYEVVAGVNMPMLFKLIAARRDAGVPDARSMAGFLRQYGQDHIFWPTGPGH